MRRKLVSSFQAVMKYHKPFFIVLPVLALSVATPRSNAQDASGEHTRKGVELAKQKKYDQAAEEFGLALKADPQDTKHYLNRGKALRMAGKLPEAEKDFSKVIEMKPDTPDAFAERGKVKVSQKNFESGIEDLTKAIEMNDDDKDSV